MMITIVILGSCFGNLSQTASNAMFSGIATDFGIEIDLGQWVTTIYMLVLGITVMLVAYLMRRFRTKSIILASLGFLLAGAVVDFFCWDFATLLIGRVLQAIAAGITLPMMMSLIMISFPREIQATVMGIAGIAMGFAPNIGPTIGGIMLTLAGWRSFFLLLGCCTLVLILAALLLIEKGEEKTDKPHLDIVSFILATLGFGSLLLGLSNASSFEITSLFIWIPALVGAFFVVLFIRRQLRVKEPLISMQIFASKRYVISFVATIFLNASFMGITLILPLFVEEVWGGTALEGGFSLIMGSIVALFINPLAGFLTDKIGIRPVMIFGSICLFVGAAFMVFMSSATPYWLIVAFQGVRQLGVSSLIGPLSSWGMADLSRDIMTDGSSFNSAARQVSASLGTALMVFAITFASASGSLDVAYSLAFSISAMFAFVTMVVCCLKIK